MCVCVCLFSFVMCVCEYFLRVHFFCLSSFIIYYEIKFFYWIQLPCGGGGSGSSTICTNQNEARLRVCVQNCVVCSLNIVFFLKVLWFFWTLPVLLQRWCSIWLVVYIHWHQEKTEKNQSPEYSKIFFEKAQYLMNTLYVKKENMYVLYCIVFSLSNCTNGVRTHFYLV